MHTQTLPLRHSTSKSSWEVGSTPSEEPAPVHLYVPHLYMIASLHVFTNPRLDFRQRGLPLEWRSYCRGAFTSWIHQPVVICQRVRRSERHRWWKQSWVWYEWFHGCQGLGPGHWFGNAKLQSAQIPRLEWSQEGWTDQDRGPRRSEYRLGIWFS